MIRRIVLLSFLCTSLTVFPSPVRAEAGTVNALFFYDPHSPACREVITGILPSLLDRYNKQLLLLNIDITTAEGYTLYQSAIAAYALPENRQTVPIIIVGDTVLSGHDEIEDQLGGRIDQLVNSGGAPWPSIPGMPAALEKAGVIKETQNPWSKFLNDQPGNSLAVLVLVGLILSLTYSILSVFNIVRDAFERAPIWLLPLVLLIGIGIASYLSYTELSNTEIICGGISNCQGVHQSPYSRLLGILPIGVFGLAGDILIGLAWLATRVSRGLVRMASEITMFGLAVFGVSFSLFLTFLEPFVIGVTCLWCLGSALVMGVILPLTIGPIREAIRLYGQGQKKQTAHP